MFEGIAGSIIWTLANVLYIDLRRKGRTGFSRFVLFWMGIPLTWLWLFLVREGSVPLLEEPPDDAEAILAEIRRERRLASGASRPDARRPASPSGPEHRADREDQGPNPDRAGS